MPVHAISLANEFLAGVFGANRGASSRDEHRIRVWKDRPNTISPSEADWGGYTPPVWSADDWLTPDGGEIFSDGLPDFGAPSSGGTDAVRYWSAHDVDTDELLYSAPLTRPVNVGAASATHVQIFLTVPVPVS